MIDKLTASSIVRGNRRPHFPVRWANAFTPGYADPKYLGWVLNPISPPLFLYIVFFVAPTCTLTTTDGLLTKRSEAHSRGTNLDGPYSPQETPTHAHNYVLPSQEKKNFLHYSLVFTTHGVSRDRYFFVLSSFNGGATTVVDASGKTREKLCCLISNRGWHGQPRLLYRHHVLPAIGGATWSRWTRPSSWRTGATGGDTGGLEGPPIDGRPSSERGIGFVSPSLHQRGQDTSGSTHTPSEEIPTCTIFKLGRGWCLKEAWSTRVTLRLGARRL